MKPKILNKHVRALVTVHSSDYGAVGWGARGAGGGGVLMVTTLYNPSPHTCMLFKNTILILSSRKILTTDPYFQQEETRFLQIYQC